MDENISVNFQNLMVSSQPKILKWDPYVPQNCDTTISYSLSSAQRKNCQVVIKVYDMAGNVVKQTTLTQLCPGNYIFSGDGTTSSGSIAQTGLYAFDIIVNSKTLDGQVISEAKDPMKSQMIKVSQIVLYIEGDQYKFIYYLEGSYPGASQVYITV